MDGGDHLAIEATGLRKRFGQTEALRGVDLAVPSGTVYGLLGPNGAGKTTAVRVLATLTAPDSGTAHVAGIDVIADPERARYRIGLVGQHAALDEKLTGRENLHMFGRLYHLGARANRSRADELLEQFELTHAADRLVKTYSGGMRRRLDLAASLIIAPAVLFLDEPTTGLDPRSRGEVWATVRSLAATGTTILLTTQYLDEADQLASEIAVVDTGRVIASGTPDELKRQIGGDRLEVVVTDPARLVEAASALARATGTDVQVVADDRRLSAPTSDGSNALTSAVRALDAVDIMTDDLALRRPTLDDVFLRLTGHGAGDEPADTDDEPHLDPIGAAR